MASFYIAISAAVSDTFNKEANAISALYSKCLPDGFKIPKLKKITIELKPFEIETVVLPYMNVLGVCVIQRSFEYNLYARSTVIEKPKLLLDIIQESIEKICIELEWNLQPFKEAYSKVLDLNFVNTFVVIKQSYSKNRMYSAAVIAEHTPQEIELSVIFYDQYQVVLRKHKLFSLLPDESYINRVICKAGWSPAGEYIIKNKSSEILFFIHPERDELRVQFNPKEHTLEFLQDELIIIDASKSKDEVMKRLTNRGLD